LREKVAAEGRRMRGRAESEPDAIRARDIAFGKALLT